MAPGGNLAAKIVKGVKKKASPRKIKCSGARLSLALRMRLAVMAGTQDDVCRRSGQKASRGKGLLAKCSQDPVSPAEINFVMRTLKVTYKGGFNVPQNIYVFLTHIRRVRKALGRSEGHCQLKESFPSAARPEALASSTAPLSNISPFQCSFSAL